MTRSALYQYQYLLLVTVGMDSSASLLHFQETVPSIRYVAYNNAMLLSAPLSAIAISLAFQPKIESLKHLTSRLRCLHAHDAIYLFRNCVTIRGRDSILKVGGGGLGVHEVGGYYIHSEYIWHSLLALIPSS